MMSAGKTSPSLCLCGCGTEVGGHYHLGRFVPAKFVRGHNRRGIINRNAAQAAKAFHEQDCVDTRVVLEIIAARWLTDYMNMNVDTARQMVQRPRIRRSTAQKILAAAAGLRRDPFSFERVQAHREAEKRRLKREAGERAALREKHRAS
jgi:hypothetical protein